MGVKFELHTQPTRELADPVGRHQVLRSDRCVSCGGCVRACIYGVHERDPEDPRQLAEPRSTLCRACAVCPQQCPRRALQLRCNPALDDIGTAPFDADSVLTAWSEALEGKIPVRGAGYGGPFSGSGFDGIWTDMSEIVRPTRDGIHGREYISTEFDLGRKLPDLCGLRFDDRGRLLDRIPLTREIPIPVLFGRLPLGPQSARITAVLLRAAMELKTFALLDPAHLLATPAGQGDHDDRARRYLVENRNHAACHLGQASVATLEAGASVVELADGSDLADRLLQLRRHNPELIVVVELAASPAAGARAVELAKLGVDAIHLACGWRGSWADGSGDSSVVTQAVRLVHVALVRARLRNELSVLLSGGLARAEHIPKAILLGADAVVLDVPLLVAMGCRVCGGCLEEMACAYGLADLDPKWAVRRVINLMSAWRNQLLEVLGAMGLREVRRLRGEVGRGLFAADLLQEFHDEIATLGESEAALPGTAAPVRADPEPSPPSRMRGHFGPWQVQRGEACARCGRCAQVCLEGVLDWPGGLRAPPPPVSERCTGPDCGHDCQRACPQGALSVTRDRRLDVHANHRWPHRLLVETWRRAEGRSAVAHGHAATTGTTGGGFDELGLVAAGPPVDPQRVDLSLDLNRRGFGPRLRLPLPIYGGGMSYGSVSASLMQGRARAAATLGTLTCTGEGGYPEQLEPYAESVITQIATGYFGVREETIQRARMVEFKYAQGAKPGLGGHLLGDKNTPQVARLREAVPGTALFSPFPFHSVYSIEDHRKHVDWVRQIKPDLLVSVKVSTPGDVDMVAVGSYHAGANVVHLDGAYGGTGAAPEVAKKNIAMPIELALSRTHRFLVSEGIREELVLMASGGVRSPMDMLKAIAMGADGVVVGTAELVAVECVLCRNCEKDRGCPRGIATTDPKLAAKLEVDWVTARIVNLYRSWERELRDILGRMGLESVRALRGRGDLLRRIPPADRSEP